MGSVNFYRVFYHYEIGGRKAQHLGEQLVVHIAAAANDFATLSAVIAADIRATPPGYALVIDNVANVGAGTAFD